jgi:hypothetical protein
VADDRTKSGTPLAELPEVTGQVRPERPGEGLPLAVRLVPIVDRIRQLNTRFGIRPYRVFLVHLQWSGNRIGDGTPWELSRKEILPTPKVIDMSSTQEILRFAGLTEEGTVRITEISAKYTEDDLMGRTPDLIDPEMPRTGLRNCEFFWELVERRPSNPPSVPRRYVPSAVPMLGRDQFEWTVTVTKVSADRPRNLSNSPIDRRKQ